LITGESGIGKTTALQQIEASWCLPRPIEPGRSVPCWLPLYVDSVSDPGTDIRESFRQNSSASLFDPKAARLSAHQRLGQLATKENLSWIFSSPVLYLVDNPGVHVTDSDSSGWIEKLGVVVEQTFGLIICCRHRSEAADWFSSTFPDAVEARLRHVDLPGARDMCTTADQLDSVQRLFSSPCEPLNQYAHNRFLLSCILDSSESIQLDASSGLVDLLDVYTKARLNDFDSIFVTGLLEEYFPNIAVSLARGESPGIAREIKNVGISQNLLARGATARFTHPLLFEYFLAKHIARNWTDDPSPLCESLLGARRELWAIRYLNLFRMLMKELHPRFRSSLAQLLARIDVHMAHRCLLELSPSEYRSVTNSSEIRDSLVHCILFDASGGEGSEEQGFATKIQAAESLAWYDPRISRSVTGTGNFIELRENEVRVCAAGQYPVTNLEYSEFVRAGGYGSDEFWLPTAWAWRSRNKITEPAMWFVEEFNRPNAPIVGISFYEALAYARWFEKRVSLANPQPTSNTFGLPRDREWAIAAGLARNVQKATEDESVRVFLPNEQVVALQTERDLRATLQDNTNAASRHGNLPVGLLPSGPCSVSDLLGNVWEWCDEWFGSPNFSNAPPSQTELSVPFPVMVRGGPATNAGSAVISLVGSGMDPFSRVFNVGFRLFQRK
jgi:formylglycine-generating enzyme required for sulfatase activity